MTEFARVVVSKDLRISKPIHYLFLLFLNCHDGGSVFCFQPLIHSSLVFVLWEGALVIRIVSGRETVVC